jgi:hypothetical protein
MTVKELELRRHIYGTTNTIVVDVINYSMLEQIELIRSTMQLDGFIFRPKFANEVALTDYTDEDWEAMYAQYSLTYKWEDDYKAFFGSNPKEVLDNYFATAAEPVIDATKVNNSEDNKFNVKDTTYYKKILSDIAQSKTVLRDQQLKIIELMPIHVIVEVFSTVDIAIKETEIQFMRRLIEDKTSFSFTEPDQIVRFVVAIFRNNGEPLVGQINKTDLKDVKVKIPTSIKKKILSDINDMSKTYTLKKMHKYKNFWKRLFKQLAWTSKDKMEKRYPNAMKIKQLLFENDYIKANTKLEMYRSQGNLEDALKEEMKNPGQMIRNLLFYLRYEQGDLFAKKDKNTSSDFKVENYFTSTNISKTNHIIHKDVKNVLESLDFYETLKKVNTKLLWQMLTLFKEKKFKESVTKRKVNGVYIQYSIPLPALKDNLVKIAKKKIKNAIKEIKRKENEALGKVYIDEKAKKYAIQFSGRTDTSMSMSGEYLPSGSIIDMNDILSEKDLDNKMLRIGIAWRGDKSCDIDLSMNVKGYGAVYYGKPAFGTDKGLIAISSGDITSCGNKLFSTEFIDVDIKKFMDAGYTEMFNSAIMFSGNTFNNYEIYWFMSVIDKKDRVIAGNKVKINIDEMDYAVQILEQEKGMLGLKFIFSDKKKECEILNIPAKGITNGMNAKRSEEILEKVLAERPKTLTLEKGVKLAINSQQIVDNIEFADIVISTEEQRDIIIYDSLDESKNVKVEQTWYHPGRDIKDIQDILY